MRLIKVHCVAALELLLVDVPCTCSLRASHLCFLVLPCFSNCISYPFRLPSNLFLVFFFEESSLAFVTDYTVPTEVELLPSNFCLFLNELIIGFKQIYDWVHSF